jgi:long-chain fatty acid transport protein
MVMGGTTTKILFTISVTLFASSALANNGLNMIGFGAESVMMGGADLAVARDTSALNTNPAGLIQISGRQLDLHSAVAFPLDVRHQDLFGNDVEVSNRHIVLGNLGYAQRLSRRPLTWGIGLFAQGGAGNDYRDLTTALGSQDDLSSIFRIAKLSGGFAYEVNPKVSLGASLSLFRADIKQKIFPNTSFYDPGPPLQAFFGYELREMEVMAHGYKLGAMYKPFDRLTIGMAYTTAGSICRWTEGY